MAVVSRLELNHPALGTTGGAALHASIEALYEKIGDAVSSRWYALADFDQTETVDLDHNFLTGIENLRYDLWNFTGGEWVKVTASSTPSLSDFSVIEKVGEESTVLQITNDTGGNDLTFAVSIVFDPLYLNEGDINDVNVAGVTDGQHLSYNSGASEWQPSDDLDGKTLQNVTYGEESGTIAANTITPTKLIYRVTASGTLDMIDPATTKALILVNDSGGVLTINELTGATAAQQIITGTGGQITLDDQASLYLAYDSTDTKWRIIGGTGSGAGGLEIQVISSSPTTEVGKHYKTDSSGGAFTITLPDPSGFTPNELANARIMVQDDALACGVSGQEVTVAPHSGGQIRNSDGTLAVDEGTVLDVQGVWAEWTWNPTDSVWMQRDIFIATAAGEVEVQIPKVITTSFSPSFDNLTTFTTAKSEYQQVGEKAYFTVIINSGSGGVASQLALNMPAGITPALANGDELPMGSFHDATAGQHNLVTGVYDSAANDFKLYVQTVSGSNVLSTALLGSSVVGARDLNLQFSLPITEFAGAGAYDTVTLEVPTPASATIQIPIVNPPTVTTVNWSAGGVGATTTQNKFVWRQVGEYLEGEIYYQHTAGGTTGAPGDLRVTLPNSLQIDSTKVPLFDEVPSRPQDSKFVIGTGIYSPTNTNTSESGLHVIAYSSTEIGFVQHIWGTDSITVLNGALLANTNATISATFRVPILDFAGALAYNSVSVPIEGGSGGSGGAGTNYILNGDAETNTANTTNVTRQTTSPLKGAAHFEVASGQTGIWATQNFDNYIVDNSIALGVSGIVDLATGGTGRVYIHDGSIEVPGTSYDLVPGLNTLGFNFVPSAASGYTLRIESTSGLIKADELVITDAPLAVGSAGGWKIYTESDVSITGTNSWVTQRARLIPYKDPISGGWRLRGNINGDTSLVVSSTVTVAGILFPTENQAGTLSTNTVSTANECYAIASTSNFKIEQGAARSSWWFSFDVEITSKPTWADFDGTVNILNSSITQSNTKFKATRITSAQSLTNGSYTDINWNNTKYIEGNVSFDGTVITFNTAGYYRLFARGQIDGTVSSANTAWGFWNSDSSAQYANNHITQRIGPYVSVEYEDYFVPGDTIKVRGFVSDAGLSFRQDNTSSFTIHRIAEHSVPKATGFGTSDEADTSAKYLLPLIQESGEGDTGTVTWDNTAPSGTVTSKYKWVRTGNEVQLYWRYEASVAGSNNNRASFVLPSDVPTPTAFSTAGSAEFTGFVGSGGLATASNNSARGVCQIYYDGADYILYTYPQDTNVATKYGHASIRFTVD